MLASPGYSVLWQSQQRMPQNLAIRASLSCTSRCTIRVRMLVGYATVSTGAQSLQAQMAALKTVVVTRLDRLARSTRDLLNLLDRLGKDNIGFKSLRETSVDTTSPQGRLVVNILASISEFECELIHARMTEGRKRAVANGVKFGPKFKLNSFQKQEALARLAAGESQSVIAKTMASTPLRFRACREGGSPRLKR